MKRQVSIVELAELLCIRLLFALYEVPTAVTEPPPPSNRFRHHAYRKRMLPALVG